MGDSRPSSAQQASAALNRPSSGTSLDQTMTATSYYHTATGRSHLTSPTRGNTASHRQNQSTAQATCARSGTTVAATPKQTYVQRIISYLESLPEEVTFREEITDIGFWKGLHSEFIATLLLILFGIGSIVAFNLNDDQLPYFSSPSSIAPSNQSSINQSGIALIDYRSTVLWIELRSSLIFGLCYASLLQIHGPISGCHTNPAITLALFVTRRLTAFRAIAYLFVQSLGALMGCLVLYGLMTPAQRLSSNFGLPHPSIYQPLDTLSSSSASSVNGTATTNTNVLNGHQQQHETYLNHLSGAQIFGYEFLSTFTFVMVYLANVDPLRVDLGFKSLSIGLAYLFTHWFTFHMTGAGLNPVRCFGSAVMANKWTHQWLYWLGPCAGGIFAGFSYEFHRSTKGPQSLRGDFCVKPSSSAANHHNHYRHSNHNQTNQAPYRNATLLSNSMYSANGTPSDDATMAMSPTTAATFASTTGAPTPGLVGPSNHLNRTTSYQHSISNSNNETEFSVMSPTTNNVPSCEQNLIRY